MIEEQIMHDFQKISSWRVNGSIREDSGGV